MATLFTFGDSITAGAQSTSTAKRYTNLLASALGVTLNNSGVSTAMVMDQYSTLFSRLPIAGDLGTVAFGTNDQAKYDVDPVKRGYFIDGLTAYILWIACQPRLAKSANGVTFTGTWSNAGLALGCYGSSSPGAKATFTASGSSIALGMYRQFQNGSTFRVRIDGIDKGLFSTGGDVRTILGTAWGPMCLVFDGLGAGSHSIEIEVVNGGSSSKIVYFHWFCPLSTARNKVAVGNIPMALGYAYGGSAANIDAYNADIAMLVQRMAISGVDVRLADVRSALSPSDMQDNVHPNDSGHSKMANVFKAAIST
ncbi:SGNH/GDSL hydrolase family protein [Agrobacterium rubi]|uniref:SGNH hydrolase-type esterase domain-containing protein n=1 Tax=Agrobacterium rubi TaxID=28099 RepID=A0ABX2J2N1_9HYPH|nr:SGNH/GDSL hydrolase family protein [Agrobacterium rubi]NTF35574.1 hypothetical protein [Agrobacterium rubi]